MMRSNTWMAFDSSPNQVGQLKGKKNVNFSNFIFHFFFLAEDRVSWDRNNFCCCCFYRCLHQRMKKKNTDWLSCHIILANFSAIEVFGRTHASVHSLWTKFVFSVIFVFVVALSKDRWKKIGVNFYVKYDRDNFVTQLFCGFEHKFCLCFAPLDLNKPLYGKMKKKIREMIWMFFFSSSLE